MLVAMFGVLINNYIVLEAFSGLSLLFVAFNLFNVRNFRITGWVGLGLTFLLTLVSLAYAQMLRNLRRYSGRQQVQVYGDDIVDDIGEYTSADTK